LRLPAISFTEDNAPNKNHAKMTSVPGMIAFQNIGYTHTEWAIRDGDGRWAAKGKLIWPWGAEYDKPQPIRVCYPDVAVRGRPVQFCGVSDIVEPYQKWRDYKRKLTGQEWDYDFHCLFYIWTDDITAGKFQPWVQSNASVNPSSPASTEAGHFFGRRNADKR
jgi:hypothetical protein